MARAGIALGSNLGDRRGHLREALAGLRALAAPGEPLLCAPVYESQAVSCPPGSADFFNTVVEIGFSGTPHELLARTRALEEQLGRTRGFQRNAPRSIDIDLLYFGDTRCDDEQLVLPHPRLAQRRFVLQPLADIRPDLVLPGHSHPIADLLKTLDDAHAPLLLKNG